jgi:hypothetical protein
VLYAWTDTESDSDLDEKALLADAREEVDESDVLMMVEFEPIGNDEAEMALLAPELVGAGEETTGVELNWATTAGTLDPYGYAGTFRSLGNGGTEGTEGSTTVGTAGTAGTCGKVGTAGTGTAGGTGSDAGAGGVSF